MVEGQWDRERASELNSHLLVTVFVDMIILKE